MDNPELEHEVRMRCAFRLADALADANINAERFGLARERAIARKTESAARTVEADNERRRLDILERKLAGPGPVPDIDPDDPDARAVWDQILKGTPFNLEKK